MSRHSRILTPRSSARCPAEMKIFEIPSIKHESSAIRYECFRLFFHRIPYISTLHSKISCVHLDTDIFGGENTKPLRAGEAYANRRSSCDSWVSTLKSIYIGLLPRVNKPACGNCASSHRSGGCTLRSFLTTQAICSGYVGAGSCAPEGFSPF